MRVSRNPILMLAVATFAIAAVAIAPASARAAGSHPPVIVVSGSGEAHAHPDLVDISFAIETHAPTAAESSSRNAALAQKVIEALKAKLAGKGVVWTGGYSLNPDYQPGAPGRKPKIVGYQTQNSIFVETGAVKMVGPLVDAAVAAGANRINSLRFTLKDDTRVRGEAIAAASRDAQAQARALAASLGVKLGRVIKASTVAEMRPIGFAMAQGMGRMVAATAPTPIEPGEVKVPATVTLTYEIE